MPVVHAQFTCKRILPLLAYDGCIRGTYQILVNPTSSGSQLLGGISTMTLSTWRHGFLSGCVEYVSSEHYFQAEVFCS